MTEPYINHIAQVDDAIRLMLAVRKAAFKLGIKIDENRLMELNAPDMLDFLRNTYPKEYPLLISEARHFESKLKLGLLRLPIESVWDNVNLLHTRQPFFYDKNQLFWFWDERDFEYKMIDEVDLMNSLEAHFQFNGRSISNQMKSQYIEAFKRVGRLNIPQDAPVRWVQFRDKAFSLRSGNTYQVTSDYFFTNPLPYEMGACSDTPAMDKLFTEWVGAENVQTLYEIIAYSCLRDYPLHFVFCLVGSGRNGKSRFLALLNKFLGQDNVCSTELDTLLDSRFESGKLYKKLVCLMGETNFGILSKTSLLKRLTGQDVVGIEYKGKMPFDTTNYAKIIVASNSLPTSEDTSEGFYRRWFIIQFPNEFEEGHDILQTIPEVEYQKLSLKVTEILPKLIKAGKISGQGTIEERKQKFITNSNPLPIFLKQCCDLATDAYISSTEFYNVYTQFLKTNKKRKVKLKEFYSALGDEGLFAEKTSKSDGLNEEGYPKYKIIYWVEGIKLKENWKVLLPLPVYPIFTPVSLYNEGSIKNRVNGQNGQQNHPIPPDLLEILDTDTLLHFDDRVIVNEKCRWCDRTECNEGSDKKPYCPEHLC